MPQNHKETDGNKDETKFCKQVAMLPYIEDVTHKISHELKNWWRNFGSCNARILSKSEAAAMRMCKQQPVMQSRKTLCARASRNIRSYQRRKTDLFPPYLKQSAPPYYECAYSIENLV